MEMSAVVNPPGLPNFIAKNDWNIVEVLEWQVAAGVIDKGNCNE